jgi:hypothetical protein
MRSNILRVQLVFLAPKVAMSVDIIASALDGTQDPNPEISSVSFVIRKRLRIVTGPLTSYQKLQSPYYDQVNDSLQSYTLSVVTLIYQSHRIDGIVAGILPESRPQDRYQDKRT